MIPINEIDGVSEHMELDSTHSVVIDLEEANLTLKVEVWRRVSDDQLFGKVYKGDELWIGFPWTSGRTAEQVFRSAIGFALERSRRS